MTITDKPDRDDFQGNENTDENDGIKFDKSRTSRNIP